MCQYVKNAIFDDWLCLGNTKNRDFLLRTKRPVS